MRAHPSGTVTFLFTDIEDSTRLWEERPESMRALLSRHDDVVRRSVDRHGGVVFATGGDGFAAAFGRAADAVEAALEAQRALRELEVDGTTLAVRMGVHTGEADERGGDYFGPPVNQAARVMGAAHGHQVVLTAATREMLVVDGGVELVDLGPHALRGVARPVTLFGVAAPDHPWLDRALATASGPQLRLPRPATPTVGRDHDLRRTAELVRERSPVTLVGPGGVGKTRLAMELGWLVGDERRGGTTWVDLAPVTEPAAVTNAIANALGVRPHADAGLGEAIVEACRGTDAVLVLDNCEHVLAEVVPVVDGLVQHCRDLRLVLTSREPLGVAGEVVVPVPSLDPAAAGIELFVARARDADTDFDPDAADRAEIARICERLDGIPLAIELAAARTRSMSLADLAGRLSDRFALLRGSRHGRIERHQTLRATVEWSYRLLDDRERAVFDACSVFAGGFDLAAAEAIVPQVTDVLDVLVDLVDKSMLVADPGARPTRYRALETLRQFGEEQLVADTELAGVTRDRHCDHFTAVAVGSDALVRADDVATGVRTLTLEWDNVRGALGWALAREDLDRVRPLVDATFLFTVYVQRLEHGDWARAGIDLARALDRPAATLWTWVAADANSRGRYVEAIECTDRALADAADAAPVDVAAAWNQRALAQYWTGDVAGVAESIATLESMLPTIAGFDHAATLFCLTIASWLVDPRVSAGHLVRFTELSRSAHNAMLDGWVDVGTILHMLYAGDAAGAAGALPEAIGRAREAGNVTAESNLQGLQVVAFSQLDDASFREQFAATLRSLHDQRSWPVILWSLETLSEHWARTGAAEDAAVVLGFLLERGQNSSRAFADRDRAQAVVGELPDGPSLLARGAAMTGDEIVAFTLAALDDDGAS